MVGKVFAWLLLVVHAQGASAAALIGLKILMSLQRPMDEKATNPIQRLLQPQDEASFRHPIFHVFS